MIDPIEKKKLTLQIDIRLSEIKKLTNEIKRKYKLLSEYISEQRESQKDSKEEVKRRIDEYCSLFSKYSDRRKVIFKEIAKLTNKKYGN
ncbi:MAG: hypothetical protein WC977_08755 [Anaerovoracaceae bacterium]